MTVVTYFFYSEIVCNFTNFDGTEGNVMITIKHFFFLTMYKSDRSVLDDQYNMVFGQYKEQI